METYLLQMGKFQMEKGWASINFDQYKGILGASFHKNIEELFNKLSTTDVTSLDPMLHTEYMQNVELVKDWITMLNYNNIENYPQSLVYTLRLLIKEWLPNYDKYIILITDNPYMVTYPRRDLDAIYQNIQTRYNILFEHKIVKICMPNMFCDDYLVNVSMYHEIGHFISRQMNIGQILLSLLHNRCLSDPNNIALLHNLFPGISFPVDLSNTPIVRKFLSHIEEYVADIFAAQYVGSNIMVYLKYLCSHDMESEDEEHPSPNLRVRMIDDFLHGSNIITSLLKTAKFSPSQPALFSVKFHNNQMSDIGKMAIVNANNTTDVHSLFANGWVLFMMDNNLRETSHPSTKGMTHKELYWKINEIIGRSIEAFAAVNKI